MSNTSIDDQEMPLVAHLTELRKRLLRCVVAILLLFGALFYFSQQIYALVAAWPIAESCCCRCRANWA